MAEDVFIYGKVGVDIMPVTKGFGRELHRKLEAELADDRFELPVNLDIDRGAYETEKERIQHDTIEQNVNLRIDRDRVARQMRDLGGQDLTVGVDADTREFRHQMQHEANQLEDILSKALNRGFDIKSSTADRALAKVQAELDTKRFKITPEIEVDLAEAERQLDRLKRRIDLSDRFDQEADKISLRARRLARTMPQLKLDVDSSQAVAKLHALADRYKRGEHVDVKVRADVEAETRKAGRELDRFQRKHDEMKMDVDLQTRMAQAHMAYFTRPRTVDILARFKGTDMGKITAGMTSGATGVEGVENQFRKLVDLMDSLDSKIPRFAIIGSVLSSLAAAATNLAGSVGGAGKSIIGLSKASYAVPAAAGAAAAGFYGLYAAVKTAGDHVSLTGTAFQDLQSKIGTRFWNEAASSIGNLTEILGPEFVGKLGDVSAEEGKVTAGIADIIAKAGEAGRINVMLEEGTTAFANLDPGLRATVSAFTELGEVGAQYLPQLTNWVSGSAMHFDEWAAGIEHDDTRVEQAMQRVKEQVGYLGSSIHSLTGVLGGTFGTLGQYENGMQGFSETLQHMDDAVNSVPFQQSMRYWISGAQLAQREVRSSFTGIGQDAYSLRGVIRNVFTDGGRVVSSTISQGSRMLAAAGPGLTRFVDGVASGWSKAMQAVGESGPMLGELATDAGQLTSTFGGTFTASLKAAAPLIELIGNGTKLTAEAFDKLPAPIKAAIGLWSTFGRAGKAGLDSIKQGMLQNIQDTLKYKATLRELGITADGNKVKFLELAQAMRRLDEGTATPFGGIGRSLDAQLPKLRQTSDEWHNVSMSYTEAKDSTTNLGAASIEAAAQSLAAGQNMGRFGGMVSKVGGAAKIAGTQILDAMGGVPGLAVTAGIGLMTTAISDYNMKATSMQQASANVSESLQNIVTTSAKASKGLSATSDAVLKNLKNKDFDKAGNPINWVQNLVSSVKDTSSAAKKLGIDINDVANAAGGSKYQFDAMNKQIQQLGDNGWRGTDEFYKLSHSFKAAQQQALGNAKTIAEQNGYSKNYVQTLYDEGVAIDQIAALTQSATQKQQNATQAKKMLSQEASSHTSALIKERAAGSQYEATLASIGQTTDKVRQLAAQGQQVWNSQTKDFDLTTEAGRTASDALGTLAQNGQAYIESMIDAGDSINDVKNKNSGINKSFQDTALQMTGNKDAAKALADQYNMTPKEIDTLFKTKTEQAKTDMLQYLALIQQSFPGKDSTAIYTTVMNAIVDGAVTDIQGVQDYAEKVSKTPYVTVLTGDDKQFRITKDEAESLGLKFQNGHYSTTLDAGDFASDKIQNVIAQAKKAGATPADIKLLLSGDKDAGKKIKNVQALAAGLGLTPAQVNLIANTDNASGKLKSIKKQLKDKGLSDKQINVLLEAIDNATPKTKSVNKEKKKVAKTASFVIRADGADQAASDVRNVADNVDRIPGVHDTVIQADDQTSLPAGNAHNAVTSIPQFWQSLLHGDGDTATVAGMAATAVFGIPASWWTTINGDGNTAANAGNAQRSILGIPTSWYSRLTAEGSRAIETAKSLYHWITSIPTHIESLIEVVASKIPGMATGGEIHGPGTGTSDSIPMMVSNGESILTSRTTRNLKTRYGADIIDRLNYTSAIPQGIGTQSLADTISLTGSIRHNAVASNVSTIAVESRTDPQILAEMQHLNSQLNDLRTSLGEEIAANSSPWPSRNSFYRDARKAMIS